MSSTFLGLSNPLFVVFGGGWLIKTIPVGGTKGSLRKFNLQVTLWDTGIYVPDRLFSISSVPVLNFII